MQYNKTSIKNKEKYLDKIINHKDALNRVLNNQLGDGWSLNKTDREWEPGGGATLYALEYASKKYFLKIKHKSVTVESKLEQETDFSNIAGLQNEYDIIKNLNAHYCPQILFFAEEDEFQFLATEYVEYSFMERMSTVGIEEILAIWGSLVETVRDIYNHGYVHCDLHENNIRFREDGSLVIIDYEESRKLSQPVGFENSLDFIGYNKISALGTFPYADTQPYKVHYNCLLRLKEVLKENILNLLPKLIKECHYDSGNGICVTIDHGESDLIYQSINTKMVKVKGQRGEKDTRLDLLEAVVLSLYGTENFAYIDIGSNNGNFCRKVYEVTRGNARCIGLEGFHKFNVLAKAISFLEDNDKIEFYDFLCGEDKLSQLNITENAFMTVCSVFHHIVNKEEFLKQIKEENVEYILFELAIQPECYDGTTWGNELDIIQRTLGFGDRLLLGYSEDYNRPMILLAKELLADKVKKRLKRRLFMYNIKSHMKIKEK